MGKGRDRYKCTCPLVPHLPWYILRSVFMSHMEVIIHLKESEGQHPNRSGLVGISFPSTSTESVAKKQRLLPKT